MFNGSITLHKFGIFRLYNISRVPKSFVFYSQIRAHERRQARERLDGEEAQSESSEDDDDDDDEEEDDLSESDTDSEEEPATVQCAPS